MRKFIKKNKRLIIIIAAALSIFVIYLIWKNYAILAELLANALANALAYIYNSAKGPINPQDTALVVLEPEKPTEEPKSSQQEGSSQTTSEEPLRVKLCLGVTSRTIANQVKSANASQVS